MKRGGEGEIQKDSSTICLSNANIYFVTIINKRL